MDWDVKAKATPVEAADAVVAAIRTNISELQPEDEALDMVNTLITSVEHGIRNTGSYLVSRDLAAKRAVLSAERREWRDRVEKARKKWAKDQNGDMADFVAEAEPVQVDPPPMPVEARSTGVVDLDGVSSWTVEVALSKEL